MQFNYNSMLNEQESASADMSNFRRNINACFEGEGFPFGIAYKHAPIIEPQNKSEMLKDIDSMKNSGPVMHSMLY